MDGSMMMLIPWIVLNFRKDKMEEEKLKVYHAFTNDLWSFFRHHANDGITDENVWWVIAESMDLGHKYPEVIKHDKLISVVLSQLLEIGERQRTGNRMIRQRLNAFFAECRERKQDTYLWAVIVFWLNWLLSLDAEQYDYGIDQLRMILEMKGHYISTEELEAYIDAGWNLELK